MVYLLVPLDLGCRSNKVDRHTIEDERASVSITNRYVDAVDFAPILYLLKC